MSTKSVTLNRNLRANWLTESLRLRATGVPAEDAIEQIDNLIATEIQGVESRRKSLRYLRQLWLSPHPTLERLQKEAFELYRNDPRNETARNLSFFMLLAVYPFAREVAEVCGQLFRLQGSVKTEQIKRKIVAKHGEREPVLRSTRYAISIFSDLGILKSEAQRGTYLAGKRNGGISNTAAFSLEALFISTGKSSISRSDLDLHPALFAFDSSSLVAAAISDQRFTLSRESMSREMVTLSRVQQEWPEFGR